jgi:hypothetical protein
VLLKFNPVQLAVIITVHIVEKVFLVIVQKIVFQETDHLFDATRFHVGFPIPATVNAETLGILVIQYVHVLEVFIFPVCNIVNQVVNVFQWKNERFVKAVVVQFIISVSKLVFQIVLVIRHSLVVVIEEFGQFVGV